MSDLKLVLVDVNPVMVEAWSSVFDGEPCIEVLRASLLDQRVSAWVAPTNSRAQMNGGLDAAIKGALGPGIQARVRRAVTTEYGDLLPLGHATCVETHRATPRYLISTPTMFGAADNVSATMNVALAFGAALQAVRAQNARLPGSISEVAVSGLGTGTGQVAPYVCAELMWNVWHLFEGHSFGSFAEMRAALEFELGDLSPAPQATGGYRGPLGPRGPVLPKPYFGRASA